jgi:endonuclease YncB( thermonuclease family)
VSLVEGSYPEDMFGRLPRYVYTTKSFVNYHMIGDGFAKAEIVPPDTKYRNLFTETEAYARTNGKGLWVTGF